MGLVILAAAVGLYQSLRPDRIDVQPYARLGEGAAQATAKLLNGSGSVVLVDADFGAYKLLAPTTEAQIKAFRRTLGKTKVKIAATERVTVAPPSLAREGIFMNPGQIGELIARHAAADAIILFVGLAGPADLKDVTLKNGKPRLVLVSNPDAAYRKLLQSRTLQMAIVPRSGVNDDPPSTGESSAQWFERHYQVVAPEDVSN